MMEVRESSAVCEIATTFQAHQVIKIIRVLTLMVMGIQVEMRVEIYQMR